MGRWLMNIHFSALSYRLSLSRREVVAHGTAGGGVLPELERRWGRQGRTFKSTSAEEGERSARRRRINAGTTPPRASYILPPTAFLCFSADEALLSSCCRCRGGCWELGLPMGGGCRRRAAVAALLAVLYEGEPAELRWEMELFLG